MKTHLVRHLPDSLVRSASTVLAVLFGSALSAALYWPSSEDVAFAKTHAATEPATAAAAEGGLHAPRATPDAARRAAGAAVTPTAPDGRSAGFVNCTVVQKGNPTDTLWWFGGADASAYSERVSLRAQDGRFKIALPLRWTILSGRDAVDFPNGRDSIVTNVKRVGLVATGPSAAAAEPTKDVRIRLEDANGLSCVFETAVLAPDHLVVTGVRDFPGPEGFVSETNFRLEDQFNRVLPTIVEINQDWGPEVSDFAGENWTWPSERGLFVNPILWCEATERCGPQFSIPPVMQPNFPVGTVKVDHRNGVIRVGSMTTNAGSPNPGQTVRTVKWQIYQDHARQE